MNSIHQTIIELLETRYARINGEAFIKDDPVSIPHLFTKKEDIEIAGFLAATISWGNRKMIIRNSRQLMNLMDDAPFDFILNVGQKDFNRFSDFCHRTFNGTDAVYFMKSLRNIYKNHGGLEPCFCSNASSPLIPLQRGTILSIKSPPKGGHKRNLQNKIFYSINHFRNIFLELPHEKRTEKHISSPALNSACKRLNMFLRWMVRKDRHGIDFGIWKSIKPYELVCPLDVHSARSARYLGLLKRKQNDWHAAVELTEALKKFDPDDPVKYDVALFGLDKEAKNTRK
ncbi:MAG: TIGR02757 family protein [Bacteroidetes bacterium]|nr:TIGR02757 family protein [Bacteroidota bacterium]